MNSFENIAGKGGCATCTICDARSYIGNSKLMADYGVDDQPFLSEIKRLENTGQTVVLVAEGKKLIGAIALSDTIRPEAEEVVARLKSMGVASSMVTGDNRASAEYVAKQVSIADIHAGLLPEDKVETVKALQKQYGKVAMVGDGVNDAPSLVTSDVGFAIGAGGTDAAIESSDITLLSGNLTNIPQSIKLARRTMRTVHVNVALALGVKVLFLVLVPFGMTNLVFAIAADSGVAILVILNSIRLFSIK
jgi:Cd2+/Zn2+-exporting ATPase